MNDELHQVCDVYDSILVDIRLIESLGRNSAPGQEMIENILRSEKGNIADGQGAGCEIVGVESVVEHLPAEDGLIILSW